MYSPVHYKETNLQVLRELITQYNFAIMISEGPVITHLPFIWDGDKLLAHMAKANTHWKLFEKDPNVTLVFNGPHGYISPSWYQPDPMNVPTWNYVAVHVTGKAIVLEDKLKMQKMVESFEAQNGTDWKLPETGLDSLYKQIVIFEVLDLKFDGKLKLSQNHGPENRNRVISELEKRNPRLAQVMKES